MLELLLAGAVASVGALLLCVKLGIRRVLGYDTSADVFFTLTFVVMFSGTYSGMMAGVFAGVMFSLYLILLKRLMGYERLIYTGSGFDWIHYPAKDSEIVRACRCFKSAWKAARKET